MDIKKRIKAQGFTLDEVAAKLKNSHGGIGISQPSMSSIINGNTTFSRLQEIASIIGLSVSELVADDDTKTSIICPYCGRKINISTEKDD
jgi:transcriptional regulator with XRE-family HTH domain